MGIWLIPPWDPHYNPMEYPDNISPVDTPYLFDPWVESLCLMLTLHTSPIKSHSGPTKVHPPSQIPDKSHKSSQLCPLFAWFVHIKSKLYRHDFASNPPWFIGCNPKCLMLKSNMFESHVIVMKFHPPPMIFPLSPIVPSPLCHQIPTYFSFFCCWGPMVTPVFWVTSHSVKSSTPMNLPDFLPVYSQFSEVALGDVVEILPGEVAPVDGELLSWDEPSGTSGGQQGWSTAAVVAFDEWPVVDGPPVELVGSGGWNMVKHGETWEPPRN